MTWKINGETRNPASPYLTGSYQNPTYPDLLNRALPEPVEADHVEQGDCTTATATAQPMKRCSRGKNCVHPQGPYLPATARYFSIDNHQKSGLRVTCKECRRAASAKHYRGHVEEYKVRHARYYREHVEEMKSYNAQWSYQHPESSRASSVKWRQKNLEKVKASSNQYCREHAKERVARSRKYYSEHAEERKAYRKQYRWKHLNEERIRNLNRRARQKALPATFTLGDWEYVLIYFNGTCAYCGKGPGLLDTFWTLHQDHFIPQMHDGGYTPDNIVPACQSCNLSKNSSDPHKWLIEYFGKRKGRQIEKRILAYFEHVRSLKSGEVA